MSDNPADTVPAARGPKRGSAPDLDAMTVQELVAHIAEAQTKLLDKQEAAKSALREKWKADAAEAGLSIDAVLPGASSGSGQGRSARKNAASSIPVKFRGPNGEGWSGRGKMPKWLQVAEAEGKNRAEFAV
ncbi:H-NS histone family protein [Roseomonas mucosa]